jgi:TRAP-type C4-dicarboxylate transport system permease small subunit
MLTPILMVFLTLVLPQSVSRWMNIIVAVFSLLFHLVGLPRYPSLYDKFLLAVSIIFNGVMIWYAWNWIEVYRFSYLRNKPCANGVSLLILQVGICISNLNLVALGGGM